MIYHRVLKGISKLGIFFIGKREVYKHWFDNTMSNKSQ